MDNNKVVIQFSKRSCLAKAAKQLAKSKIDFLCKSNLKHIELDVISTEVIFDLIKDNYLVDIDFIRIGENHYDCDGVSLGY